MSDAYLNEPAFDDELGDRLREHYDQDLDPAALERIQARIEQEAALAAPAPRPARRWIQLAAAAGLLLAVGGGTFLGGLMLWSEADRALEAAL